MLAYSAVFAGAIALVRVAGPRWPAILGGLALASVIVCGYALLTKIFPDSLNPTDTYARLAEPFGYWNAVGLAAAMGAICCMWLGSRRAGHALLSALAYPALGLLLLTLILAYSRGSLAALMMGLVLWFAVVPLRLRGAALLILAGLCRRRRRGMGLQDARPQRRSRAARAADDGRSPARRRRAADAAAPHRRRRGDRVPRRRGVRRRPAAAAAQGRRCSRCSH